jgi:VIT1/CCC1 family predicted Fe2+/Mn2+ transporter
MSTQSAHGEGHAVSRLGWLRAAVLGANDGLLSTSSLIIGVATANGSHESVIVAGFSGLVAGAMAMAAGEYVSVSSQSDSEAADIAREMRELHDTPDAEHAELTGIYIGRGVKPELAAEVATQLMAHDALGAHARDELGIMEITAAKPVQAAGASASAFSVGAALPLLVSALAPMPVLPVSVAAASVVFLALLGAAGAKTGGAGMLRAAIRVVVLGVISMAITGAIGRLVGMAVSG